MTMKWIVVYSPFGKRESIDISHAMDYELNDYDLASRREFDDEEEAALYAEKLSKNSGIPLLINGNHKRYTGILD